MVEQDFVIATKDERQQYITCPEHDIPLTELVPGSLSHIVTTKNMLVSFLTMKAGSVFNLHTHPQEQFMIVIEGFCDEVIGDKIYRVEAGEVIHCRQESHMVLFCEILIVKQLIFLYHQEKIMCKAFGNRIRMHPCPLPTRAGEKDLLFQTLP